MTQAQTSEALRVLVATPYGRDGMGGIDRLNDSIFEILEAEPGEMLELDRLVTRGKGSLLQAPFVFAAAMARFVWLAARGRVDVLHIHISGHGSSYRKAILGHTARLMGVPYTLHLHGVNYREFWAGSNAVFRSLLDAAYRNSARVIVLGAFWADVIKERVSDARVTILPNATPAVAPYEKPHKPDGGVQITFLGQLGSRKGSPQLIEALSRLKDHASWTAVLAGDGEIEQTKSLIAQHDLSDRIEVPGWIGVEKRASVMQTSDVLVLPSFAENLPMVILEAFSHGIPVIATPVGAIPEVIIDGENGLLVEPGDVDGLTEAIKTVIEQPELRAKMGAKARQDHGERFELGGYARQLAGIWRACARRGSDERETKSRQQLSIKQAE